MLKQVRSSVIFSSQLPRGPIFDKKSFDRVMKNLWKSLTYEKLRISNWIIRKSYKNPMKTQDEVMQNL